MATRTKYQIGQTIGGRYRLEGVLGSGGFGTVFRARQAPLDRPVAVKVCHANAQNAMAYARFEGEARIIGALRSPHTVRLYDFGLTVDGHPFFAMELIAGHSLAHEIQAGPLSPRRMAAIVMEVCESLAEAHASAVIHLDLKPSNVMLECISGRGEMARVLDFGIATVASESQAKAAGSILGTPRYMAPEQFAGGPVTAQTDLFGLGLLMDECLRGSPTFTTGELPLTLGQHFTERPPVPPSVPESLRLLLNRLLDIDPHRRPSSATEVREVLGDWLRTALSTGVGHRPVVTRKKAHMASMAPTADLHGRAGGKGLMGGAAEEALADETATDIAIQVNLPYHASRFVGREAQFSALYTAFTHEKRRLVTLVGTGGAGKSRLSVRYGYEAQSGFSGGVWFCDLSAATTVHGIAVDVAKAFDLPLGAQDPVAIIGDMFAMGGRTLVILDNFEQVVAHADSTIGHWLRCAREVCFLVTSRSPLRLAEEAVIPVPPVNLEDAVTLFVERAQEANPNFHLTEENRSQVQVIVQQLDRLPLALELAAARLSMLSLDQLETRLKARFRVLRTGGVTAQSRQVNMRAAIDWSWALLTPIERLALAQCSVFRGGFALVDAEAVLELSGASDELWPDEVLAALIDKSLVRRWATADGGFRFGLYESIRAFASEKLESEDAVTALDGVPLTGPRFCEALSRRHAVRYGRWGRPEALGRLHVHGQEAVHALLRLEFENLMVGFETALNLGMANTAGQCALALGVIFCAQGPFALGRAVVERALASDGLDPEIRALAMYRLTMLLGNIGDRGRARELMVNLLEHEAVPRTSHLFIRVACWLGIDDLEQSKTDLGRWRLADALLAARENGDKVGEALILGPMAHYHHTQFEMPRAGACYELALRVARETGNLTLVTTLLLHQGTYFDDLGQIDDAEKAFLSAAAHAHDTGHKRTEAASLTNLALLYRVQGRFSESKRHGEAALTLFRQMGSTRGAAMTRGNLGDLYYEMGDLELARSTFLEVVPILDECIPMAAGAFRGSVALICAEGGDFDAAYTYLDSGEVQLRNTHAGEFGKIRCRRGMVDLLAGDYEGARNLLTEVEQILRDVGAGPNSELAQAVALLRERLEHALPH